MNEAKASKPPSGASFIASQPLWEWHLFLNTSHSLVVRAAMRLTGISIPLCAYDSDLQGTLIVRQPTPPSFRFCSSWKPLGPEEACYVQEAPTKMHAIWGAGEIHCLVSRCYPLGFPVVPLAVQLTLLFPSSVHRKTFTVTSLPLFRTVTSWMTPLSKG